MMKLFGKDILLQKFGCSDSLETEHPMRPYVNLYVKVTNGCNARCAFCCNAGCNTVSGFDMKKLFDCMAAIVGSGIKLNRVSLTGGEPSLCEATAQAIIEHINEEYHYTQLQLNTNGLTDSSRRLMRHPRLDSISVSLHHYDKQKAEEIFDAEIDGEIGRFPGIDTRKLNLSCNLIREYIDNADEISHYLDFAASRGVRTVGFVSLMKKTDYCRKHFVDFSEIDFGAVPNLYLTRERHNASHCKCRNYIYRANNGNMIEVYMRENINPEYCASSLLFDGEYLRQGFGYDNIIY